MIKVRSQVFLFNRFSVSDIQMTFLCHYVVDCQCVEKCKGRRASPIKVGLRPITAYLHSCTFTM